MKTLREFLEEATQHVEVLALTEDKTYSMDYDGEEEDTKGAKALDAAHDHFKKQGYKISHEGSDDPAHKERKNPDVTYHYAMGDDMHHAFTVHKSGKAAGDAHIKKLTKNLEDVTESVQETEGEDLQEATDIELKPHENGTHYIVHKIHPNSGIESDQLKTGEKISDTHVDDLHDMGYKVKIHKK